jgi:hypothetical protein
MRKYTVNVVGDHDLPVGTPHVIGETYDIEERFMQHAIGKKFVEIPEAAVAPTP